MVDGTPLTVRYIRMLSRTRARIVWYWYWVDGRFTPNLYVATLLEAKAKILGDVSAAAVIATAADYTNTPAEAERVHQSFLEDTRSLRTTLDQTAERQRLAGTRRGSDKLSAPDGES